GLPYNCLRPIRKLPMHDNIESHLKEKRVFKPAKNFAQKARIKNLAQYQRMYRESIKRPDKFWSREAKELSWQKPWRKVLEWKAPFAKWFIGGKLNLSENCLDRHLTTHRRNKAAILWEGEPGEKRTLTYQQLHREVCRFAYRSEEHTSELQSPDHLTICHYTTLFRSRPWRKVLEWKAPFAKWFIGGKLNLSENCLDRHLTTHRRNKAAILWEGEPGEKRTLTYQQLHREVCRFAN